MYRLRDVIAIEADDVVGDDASEELFDERFQFGVHLLQLGDQIGEELGHVLLFAGVQRLFVHRVNLAETLGIVRLSFGSGQKGEEPLQFIEDLLVLRLRRFRQCASVENPALGRPDHEQVLHAAGHVASRPEVRQPDEIAARSSVLVRPIIPRIRPFVRSFFTMLLSELFRQNDEVGEGAFDELDHDVVTRRPDRRSRRG